MTLVIKQHGGATGWALAAGNVQERWVAALLGSTRAGCPARFSATRRAPLPGAEAGHGDHPTGPRGRESLERWCRSGVHRAVAHACPVVAHEAAGQTAGGQVATTGKWGWGGWEKRKVSSS